MKKYNAVSRTETVVSDWLDSNCHYATYMMWKKVQGKVLNYLSIHLFIDKIGTV